MQNERPGPDALHSARLILNYAFSVLQYFLGDIVIHELAMRWIVVVFKALPSAESATSSRFSRMSATARACSCSMPTRPAFTVSSAWDRVGNHLFALLLGFTNRGLNPPASLGFYLRQPGT